MPRCSAGPRARLGQGQHLPRLAVLLERRQTLVRRRSGRDRARSGDRWELRAARETRHATRVARDRAVRLRDRGKDGAPARGVCGIAHFELRGELENRRFARKDGLFVALESLGIRVRRDVSHELSCFRLLLLLLLLHHQPLIPRSLRLELGNDDGAREGLLRSRHMRGLHR